MVGGGRIVGAILMIGSALLLLGFAIWAFSEGNITGGGRALGIFVALLAMAPIFGIGFYLFRRGTDERAQFATVQQEKTILNMVLTQGQVTIPELMAELQTSRDAVEEMIRDLVGKRLFSGAINWDKGILYSVESQQLTENRTCPNCGGKLEFAGKGLVVCPYCGSEVFLTPRAAAETATEGAA